MKLPENPLRPLIFCDHILCEVHKLTVLVSAPLRTGKLKAVTRRFGPGFRTGLSLWVGFGFSAWLFTVWGGGTGVSTRGLDQLGSLSSTKLLVLKLALLGSFSAASLGIVKIAHPDFGATSLACPLSLASGRGGQFGFLGLFGFCLRTLGQGSFTLDGRGGSTSPCSLGETGPRRHD